MKKYVLPTICIDEVKFCKEGQFFFAKYKENNSIQIMSKFNFDEVLFGLTKQGFEIINNEEDNPIDFFYHRLLKQACSRD